MRAKQRDIFAALSIILMSYGMLAQSSPSSLPNEPKMRTLETAFSQASSSSTVVAQAAGQGTPLQLTRQEAEKTALANNPHIHISQLLARVQHQVIRERRADELPNLNGALTAVEANDGSRISSGSLTASRLLVHAGMGVQLSQLITDFGRTSNLIASAKLQEKAKLADAEASREDIVLATDQAFYAVVEAQETLAVAIQTVSTRQALTDQVSALTSAKLKSDLDLSFAQVNLSQAKLLQLNAQNDLDAAKAGFTEVLGYERPMDFALIDDSGALPTMPPDPDTLVTQAIQNRPDLQSLRFS
jgi:outer membrane protein